MRDLGGGQSRRVELTSCGLDCSSGQHGLRGSGTRSSSLPASSSSSSALPLAFTQLQRHHLLQCPCCTRALPQVHIKLLARQSRRTASSPRGPPPRPSKPHPTPPPPLPSRPTQHAFDPVQLSATLPLGRLRSIAPWPCRSSGQLGGAPSGSRRHLFRPLALRSKLRSLACRFEPALVAPHPALPRMGAHAASLRVPSLGRRLVERSARVDRLRFPDLGPRAAVDPGQTLGWVKLPRGL